MARFAFQWIIALVSLDVAIDHRQSQSLSPSHRLVVKKGSKIRSFVLFYHPAPVSVQVIFHNLPGRMDKENASAASR